MRREAATPQESIAAWRMLHSQGYFTRHRVYQERLHDQGVAQVASLLGLAGTEVLLEIGCGYGRLLWHLAPLVRRAIGVDIDPLPLTAARELLAEKGNADCVLGDGVSLSCVADESVDVACAFTVFQHLPRGLVDAYLADLVRVLVPGGRACLQFFSDGTSGADVQPGASEQSVSCSASQVCAAVERAALEVVHLEQESLEYLGYPSPLKWWWVLARRPAAEVGVIP